MKVYSLLIRAVTALFMITAATAQSHTTIAFSKNNPRASLFIASGYKSQQEADDAALNGCKANLAKRNFDAIECNIIDRQPRQGYGAVACQILSCYFGYADTEPLARDRALAACRADSSFNEVVRKNCVIGISISDNPQATAGVWLDDGSGRPQPQLAATQRPDSSPAQASQQATSESPWSSRSEPTGSLKLLCQLNTGNAYVFVVDEAKQTVAVRDSTGQDWVTFRTGQTTRQRVADSSLPMIDAVRVDASSIRALRSPRDEKPGNAPQVSNNRDTNELVGLLGDLFALVGTASSVEIDRNSGSITTGGMGIFPNKATGICQPWAGRRF